MPTFHPGSDRSGKPFPAVRRSFSLNSTQRFATPHASEPALGPVSFDFGKVPIQSSAARGIQTQLAIGGAADPLEQQADRVAERVLRMPESQMELGDRVSGAHGARQSAEIIQAKSAAASGSPLIAAPPLVHEVLNSPGQPLDAASRDYFEPRFGVDFSRVRIYDDPRAAASARQLNALAYTVGNDIVVGAGGFAPTGGSGQKLLAHELAHVVQQAEASSLSLQRWQISSASAIADQQSDTLPALAVAVDAQPNDWECIRPLSMSLAESAAAPADFNEHYERYISVGDSFDISNLREPIGGSAAIHLFNEANLYTAVTKKFYPGIVGVQDADGAIAGAARGGLKPIGDFVIVGHANSQAMFGDVGVLIPKELNSEEPAPSHAGTQLGIFPRRCWFTRNATVRAVGCDSEAWGQDFANHFLRQGAKVTTTTAAVRGRCSGRTPELVPIAGECRALDGFEFASSYLSYGVNLEGPFWSAEQFHAGTYWSELKGTL